MTMKESTHATIGKNGFILLATLWMLAMLSIAASFFALWTERAVNIAQSRQANIQGEIDMISTEANIIYILSSQRFTIAGLTIPEDLEHRKIYDPDEEVTILPVGKEIALDDRPYFGHGKAFFAIQDEGGLLNINIETEVTISRFLGLLGVDANLHGSLTAKLKDYIDMDDLHRINGAESYHYKKRGLPRNNYLYHQMELQQVLDWKEQSTLWKNHKLKQLTQLWLPVRPNVNTAPALVLQAAYQMSAESAARIIAARKIQPFYTSRMVREAMGEPLNVDPFEENYFPSTILRLTLWHEKAQRMRQVFVQLTPSADKKKPWQVEFRLEFDLLPIYRKKPYYHVQTPLFNSTLSAKAE